MNNYITVIDIEVGKPEYGFAIRVGKEPLPLGSRLANCISWDAINKTAGWNMPLFRHEINQEYTQWTNWKTALEYATQYRDAKYPTYKVRVDCTIA